MKTEIFLLGLGLAVVSALPTEDLVITKLDAGGPRYQYMTGPDGPQLVDLWLKKSDMKASARYNPDSSNNYHLFTRRNPTTSRPIPLGSTLALRTSHYDISKKTVVLIHGWGNVPTSNFNTVMVNASLTGEDVNVIMVDWSIGAAGEYVVAMSNVAKSAEHVAKYINWLLTASGGDIDNFFIIGHSLGAHQAGIVGRHLGGKIPYISGLDPAMPGWITNSQAISSNAAIYTEVMHTAVGTFGILAPAGDVDFYPNGGRDMPGCDSRNCDHHRCVFYMAESLIQGGFTGRRCNSVSSAVTGDCNLPETLLTI